MNNRILAIDTTTTVASVAIYNEGKTYFGSVDNKITHSEKLMPLIDELLHTAKLSIKDITLICVVSGPGSFTGIRIGLACAKGLALALNIPIFAVTSLELLAWDMQNKDAYILSIIDSKHDKAYYQLFDDNMKPIFPPSNNNLDYIKNSVLDQVKGKKIYVVGNIECYCTNYIASPNILKVFDIYLSDNYKVKLQTAYTLLPTYVLASEAQRKKGEE